MFGGRRISCACGRRWRGGPGLCYPAPAGSYLLDLMLPKVDGFEVCRALKNNEETKDIPIIVLTARTGMEDRQRVAELVRNHT